MSFQFASSESTTDPWYLGTGWDVAADHMAHAASSQYSGDTVSVLFGSTPLRTTRMVTAS